MSLSPSEDTLRILAQLKIAYIKDHKWTYSPEFEKSVQSMKVSPPGFFESTKMANRARDEIIPVLMTHGAEILKNKIDRDNLIVAYMCYDRHMGRNKKLKFTEYVPEAINIPNILYAIFMLNKADIPVEID